MDSSYVIGIGGTGSKCVESFLHLSASGLGPDRIGVALVDQDLSNGNLTRTKQLLSLCRTLHDKLHLGEHRLNGCSLLHTHFTTADTPEWSPLREKQATLDGHFNYKAMHDEAKLLFECLFERRFEREQSLEEGFRGRPAVGAAAMFSAATSRDHFWERLFSDMNSMAKEERIQVFLFSSIFGGTGASGFPTIARIIREMAEEQGVKMRIGGTLLLPYFKYPKPPESLEQRSVALSQEFPGKSRQALEYYHNLITYQDPDLYDQIYLVGFDPLMEIDYFKEGGHLQRNIPLIPELLSALAGLNFFQGEQNASRQVLRAGRNTWHVSWDQIPKLNLNAKGHDVRQHLGRLIRFALAYLLAYYPHLQPDTYKKFQNQTWFKRLIADAGVEVDGDDVQELLAELARYCHEVLKWAASLCPSRGAAPDINLFDFTRIVGQIDQSDASVVDLKLSELTAQHKKTFRCVIPPATYCGLDGIFDGLSRADSSLHGRGLGAFLHSLFDECHV